jgi:hypothetical protein
VKNVKLSELAMPVVFVAVWLLLQLVVLPRLGVST